MWRRKRMLAELDEDISEHLETETQENIDRGMTPQEARCAAVRKFGNVTRVKEEVRGVWYSRWLEQLDQDLRYGLRMLRKSPGFTAIAVLTLGLGIGANTAIFSAVNALLLQRLPVVDSDRIVFGLGLREGFDPYGLSRLEYDALKERGHSFANLGVAELRSFNLIGRNDPERVQGAAVQAEFLEALGVQPILGQSITKAEDYPGGPPVALLGYGLWMRRFAGAPGVIGQALDLNGRSTAVIGVLPPSFDYPGEAQIWIPLQMQPGGLPLSEMAAHNYEMVARLRPGVSAEQADDEVRRIARELENEYPAVRRGWSSKVIPMRRELLRDVAGRVEKSLVALLGAVGFLLLICCANVAGLLMARGVVREREMAMRRAMGAGCPRIVRQLLTESVLLAALGGLAGLALAYGILPLLCSLNPVQTTAFAGLLRGLHVDGRALLFASVLTLVTGVTSGFLPAIKRAAAKDLMPLILEGNQRSSSGTGSKRMLGALVVAEMAIAITLLAGGALMIQSFQRLKQIDVGFRPEGLLTMHMELSPNKYTSFPQRAAFVRKMLDEIQKVPGVVSAGVTTNLPLTTFSARDSVFAVEGHPPANPGDVPITSHRLVSPDYLRTLGVALVEGRLLDKNDRQNTQPVAVISEEFAKQGFGNEDPLGKHVKRIRPGMADTPWFTVVGVVRNVKEDRDNFRIDRPVLYLPYEQQENDYALDLMVRVKSNPAGFAAGIRQAILAVDADQPVSNVITMRNHLEGMLVNERFSAILMAGLAGFGVLLAIIGLYGVMAYSVSRQTGEIGLRVALGAAPSDIFKMVLGRGSKLVVLGVAIGLACALALTRLLASTLYGIRANDPGTFAATALLLCLAAIVACYLPARRAMRVDPIVALRYE